MKQDDMTDNGTNGRRQATSGPLHLIQPCPPDIPCPGSASRVAPSPYDLNTLSNEEAAELTEAKVRADLVVAGARTAIDGAVKTLLAREGDMTTALHRLATFVVSRDLAECRDSVDRVRRRHEHDGPEDRRRRPGWTRWAVWFTVLAAGIFDTAFFAAVFLRMVDEQANPTSVTFYVSLLPGVIITVGLLAAGHWFAEALLRSRSRSERRLEHSPFAARLVGLLLRRKPTSRKREPDSLPWSRWLLPVCFVVVVVGTLGVWAYNRALESTGKPVDVPTSAVALLLLMFSIIAIATKAIYHNPFADSARVADRRLEVMEKRAERTVADAGTAVADFDAANRQLRGLLDELAAAASRTLDQAWQRILLRRHEHGLAGPIAPAFAASRPDLDSMDRQPLLDALVEPRVWLAPLREARDALRDAKVDRARADVHKLVDKLATQRTRGDAATEDGSPPRQETRTAAAIS
jgi:hypothetical protein